VGHELKRRVAQACVQSCDLVQILVVVAMNLLRTQKTEAE